MLTVKNLLDEYAHTIEELRDQNKQMLAVLEDVDACAEYWSEYYVPVGIHDRIKSAIAIGKTNTNLKG